LGNSNEHPDEQSDNTATTDQGASATSSEADATEEKAEAMFENVSEKSGIND